MLPSIVALLALSNAQAANNPTELANELAAACTSGLQTVTITLPAEIYLDPSEVVVYPPAAGCPDAPDLVFEPQPGLLRSEVHFEAQSAGGEFNLFTIQSRDVPVSATFRNIQFIGPLPGDPGNVDPNGSDDDVSEATTPLCGEYGGDVRGVLIDGSDVAGNVRPMLTLEETRFTCLDAAAISTTAGSGGAVYAIDAMVTVRDSFFEYNSANAFGGAIAVTGTQFSAENDSVALRIENSDFLRNDALTGGAVRNDWAQMNTVMTESRMELNFGAEGAGGLDLIDQFDVTLERNEFDRQNPRNLDIQQLGGAIRIDSRELYDPNTSPDANNRGSLAFTNNILCGSWAGRGGGLYVDTVPNVNIEGSVFAENGGLEFGGGAFITTSRPVEPEMSVIHNTFVGNEAGWTPDWFTPRFVYTIGGGAGVAFFGTNPDNFQNNIVAYSDFGGGVMHEYIPFSSDGFEIGDPLNFYNNLWFQNLDGQGTAHVTSDTANLAMHPTNLVNVDPQLTYLGIGEYNCVPEAFYPLRTSPVIDAGGGPLDDAAAIPTPCEDWADNDVPADYITDGPVIDDLSCDIGAFGGINAMWSKDTDQDGYTNIFDCDDNNPDINPGAPELCDYMDNNCNGQVDEGIQSLWYPDADGDGFGQANVQPVLSCEGAVPNHVSSIDPENPLNTDCDDANPDANPATGEVCDGADNDCNGDIDDGLDFIQYFPDTDQDGYGDEDNPTGQTFCAPPFPGMIEVAGDCNDEDPNVNEGTFERCGNGVDDDCDDLIDQADPDAGANEYYLDTDGDGDGDINSEPTRSCDPVPGAGYSITNNDCNDLVPEINGFAMELCNNNLDEDCDGVIDEADANTADATRLWPDTDADTFGNGAGISIYVCDLANAQQGYVANSADCNDADPAIGECGTGCSSTAGQGGAFAVLLGLLAIGGRRRRD